MKKILFSVLFAVFMLSTTGVVFAANTITITDITVLEEQDGEVIPVETYSVDSDDIVLDYSQMLKVEVKVKDDKNNAVSKIDTSFLSYLSAVDNENAKLGNSTIQHAVLKTTLSDGTAAFVFRPRDSVGLGEFIAKIGAEDASVTSFNYTVTEIPKAMNLVARNNSMPANSQENATFVINAEGFTDTDYSAFEVYLGDSNTPLTENYTIELSDGDILLTVNNVVFSSVDNLSGKEFIITVKYDGYKKAGNKIVLTPAEYNIELVLNGGEINGETPQKYVYGVGLPLPTNVTRKNHYFTGWYTDEDCSGAPATSISATDTGSKKFFAGWTSNAPTEYLITFVDYDGTVLKSENVGVGDIPSCEEPSREEDAMYTYKFVGWEPTITEVTEIATYKAVYSQTPQMYSITLDYDGGRLDGNDSDITGYTYGVGAVLPVPVRNGFIFGGWYDNEDFIGDAVRAVGADEIGNKIYYAKWTQIEETVVVDAYDDYQNRVSIEKLTKGSTTQFIVTAKNGETLPNLTMYNAIYTNGLLKKVTKIPRAVTGNAAAFKFSTPQTVNGEVYKLMLWDNNIKPVIKVISN